MAPIPREIVEAVRDRTDLVALIGRHVRLEKRGKDWTGLCPFHKEKSPSFHVIPSKQFYYCYGCQASGDCFAFLTKFENLTFYEAVKQLAEAAGVRIEEAALSPAVAAQITATQRRLRVLDAAAQHFQSLLWVGQEGADARAYLQSRALPDDVAQAFGLGLAPAGFHALSDMLTRKGVDPEDVIAAGLAKRSDTGGTYDLFRNRLMIPITDARGRTVAFGGRLLTGEGPKYINSPETALYRKGSVLYGWTAAQKQMRTSRRVILVEGYFDVIAMHRAGMSEAVATCGTALTEEHVKMIRTMVPAVYLLTDTDRAGEIAAEKALPLLREAGLQTFRPTLVDAKDPDEALQKHGAEALQAALSSADTLLSAVARRKLREYGFNAGGKLRALDEMLELLPDVADVEVQELASTLGMTVAEINKRHKARRRGAEAPPSGSEGQPPPPPRLVLSRPNMHLLWLALHRRDEVADLLDAVVPSDLDARIRPIVARLLSGEPPLRILDEALPDDLRDLLARGLARTELYAPSEARQALAQNAMVLAFERLETVKSELLARKPSKQEAATDPERFRAWLGRAAALNQRKKDATAAMQRKDWAAVLDVLRHAG